MRDITKPAADRGVKLARGHMQETVAARNLRTAERFLVSPPLAAKYGGAPVAVCDLSEKGARFRHEQPLETGAKALLQLEVEGRAQPLTIEGVVVWTQPEGTRFVSGVRMYGSQELMTALLAQLQTSRRAKRVEELRSTDRFAVAPPLIGMWGEQAVLIEDLSARGARIEVANEPLRGDSGELRFRVPESSLKLEVAGQVAWTAVKAVGAATSFRAGLFINEKPEQLRLAIGRLCDTGRAALDTQSLRLKLKIIRARARNLAAAQPHAESFGIPAEQYLLIQGVREELRLNAEEAMYWYRRARMIINDPATRAAAPPIASHPDALAVWEYLDRSVDPSIVGRAFELP